jgi:ABC-2 type transport system permease protein
MPGGEVSNRGFRGMVRSIRTVGMLTLDTLFWSRKTVFMALVSALVIGIAVLGRLILSFNWVRAPFTPAQVFGTLMSTAVIHFLVVFLTLFYGTALVSDEVEGKTLTYLFTRPVPKPAIMAGKLAALFWICLVLVFPTVIASYAVLYAGRGFLDDVGLLGRDLAVVGLALSAYGSFFALLGAWLKHPVLPGLIYAFGWEGIVSYLPGFTRKLTITHYVQSIFPHDDSAAAIAMMIGERTETAEAIVTLVLLTALLGCASCLILREKEYVLEQ